MVKTFILQTFIFLCFFSAVAQNSGKISGRILDEKTGEPLVGVSLMLINEKTGTVSDAEGYFSMAVQSLPVTLSVHYIGYQHQEIEISRYTESLSILLSEDTNELNEIVVIGYGTQRRKELTGSVATVSKAHLDYSGDLSIDALLGGAVAGLNVTQVSGQPGAAASMRIRGGNSINASNEPLYVIDGIIVYPRSTKTGTESSGSGIESSINPLSAINPANIESISVLKDVSATAIFGSRGANGVIIITSKKGSRNKDVISYNVTASWNTPAKKLQLMNARQWIGFQREYFGDKGNITDEQLAALGNGYDWQSEALQNGFSQKHDVFVSGGDDKTKYAISGNYVNQNGIMINSGFRRNNLQISIDREVSKYLTVGAVATFGKGTQNSLTTATKKLGVNGSTPFGDGITNSLTYALLMPPAVPIYNENGDYNFSNPYESSHFSLNGRQANPIYDLKNSVAESINKSVLANFYAHYTIFNGLVAKATLSTDQSAITQNFFAPSASALGLNESGVGAIGKKEYETGQADATLDYSKRFNDIHFINILGGYTYQNVQRTYQTIRSSHYINEDLKQNKLGFGEQQSLPVNGASDSELHSLISRLNYTLLERYNLTATFRSDYSDRFAEGNRWGYFPSIGFSWNVNNDLKLRLTAGTVGNTEIDDYLYAQIYNPQIYSGRPVFVMENKGNGKLTWETTTQYNAGADAGLLNDRLRLVADVYYKKTRDLLLEKSTELGSAVDHQMVNIGNVTNKGIELGINIVAINNRKQNWTISANIARNVNEITYLGGDDDVLSGEYSEQILRVGEAYGSFFGYVFDGIVQSNEDVSQLPTRNGETLEPGDVKFVDTYKDGNIDLKDRVILGSTHPDFTYGLSSTFTYQGFDLFVSFQGTQGNEVVNVLRRTLEHTGSSYNLSVGILDAWTSENPSNEVARIPYGLPAKQMDSRYVEDASYFRLKDFTLGRTFQVKQLPFSVRVFASAQNLFTLTRYKGYDPEVAGGIDNGAYPTARIFSVGVGLTID
jgi:TonB-linked SusC/RagA family outer membrane protein